MLSLRCMGAGAAALAAALVLGPRPAAAGGYELTSAGARANGRAGANHVGSDSPMGLFYNPATLAGQESGYHVTGSLHMHFSERCMQRVEVVEDDEGNRSEGETFPTVCSDGSPTVLPQLAFSKDLADGLTLGAGVYVPPAAFRSVQYGNPETVMAGGQPTPTRYLLVEADLLQAFPTVGAAYELHPQVRLGAAFGWGITKVDFVNTAFSRVTVLDTPLGDIDATADARNAIHATDAFVPRLNFGVWAQPVKDLPLELGLSFQWTGDVKTDEATLDLESFNSEPIDADAEATIEGVGFEVPQTSRLALGARYAMPLDKPVDDVGDRLSSEVFDVEANLVLTFGKRVDSVFVDIPDDATLTAEVPVPGVDDVIVDLPDEIAIEHRWKTQVALRLGADYNPLPGLLGLRAGLSFESDGVQKGYEQLDFTPFRRVGLHLGATVRIASMVDLSVAYAHIFQPDNELGVQDAQFRRTVGGNEPPLESDATVVNAGTITSDYDVLIVEGAAHF